MVNVEGTDYYIGHFFKANWFKSAEYCRYHGMHLASITSKEQNDALEKIINDYGSFSYLFVVLLINKLDISISRITLTTLWGDKQTKAISLAIKFF